MEFALFIAQRKRSRRIRREIKRFKGNHDNALFHSIEIAQFKFAAGEFFVPADTVQKIVDGGHTVSAMSLDPQISQMGADSLATDEHR